MFPGSDIEQIEVRRMDEAMTETMVENRLAEYDVEIAAQFATGAGRR